MSIGCPNCEPVLALSSNEEEIQSCTSANFNGTIAVMDPKRSWVAKWQRLDRYEPGIYAVQVLGQLPKGVIQDLEEQGIKYVPRDAPMEEDDMEV